MRRRRSSSSKRIAPIKIEVTLEKMFSSGEVEICWKQKGLKRAGRMEREEKDD